MKIIIFACSNAAEDLLKILSNDLNLIGFCDNNKKLHNKQFKGKTVYSANDIKNIKFDYIIVASMHYEAIIKQLTETIGVPREKILVFTGSYRCPKSVGHDNNNDKKLAKLLKKSFDNKIGFSLLDKSDENCILEELYKDAPQYILDKYYIEKFNYKEKKEYSIVIHENINSILNYLTTTNIVLWKGLSFKEISKIRDIPKDYVLDGAYIHGISHIMLKGDYSKGLPCVSWNINNDKLTVLGIPNKNIKKFNINKDTKFIGSNLKKIIYIPSPLYRLNSEMPTMDCFYIEPYIKELSNKSEKLKSIGLEVVIALPNPELVSLKTKETTNIKLIEVESDYFYDALLTADIVVTDNSIYGLQYSIFRNNVIHFSLNVPNYKSAKGYILKGYNNSSLVHYAKNVDEMLNIAVNLLENGDKYANERKIARDKLLFNSDDELLKRLWQEIYDCLESNN